MTKIKDQKTEKTVNKEFEQALSAINPGENLEIERPPEKRGVKIWVVGALAVAIVAATAWFFVFKGEASLADQLPDTASIYFSLALPRAEHWYDRIFFWRESVTPSRDMSRLYQKLDVISWPGADWQKQILPLINNRVEIARLDNGTLILRAELVNRDGWLAVAQADQAAYKPETGFYQGEITKPADQSTYFGGWWRYLTKTPNKISWLLKNGNLYISDQPNLESFFGSKRSLPKFERGLFQAFVKDKAAFESLDTVLGQFFAPDNVYPMKVVARNVDNTLVWQAGEAEKKFTWDKASSLATSFDSSLTVTGRDIGQSYAQWQAVLTTLPPNQLTKNINELSQITKEFYGLDLEAVFNKIGGQEVILQLGAKSGQEWLFQVKGDESGMDNELLEYLQKFASALFAISHPLSQEHKLSDGTTMVELRASRDGLEWQPLQWTSNGQQYSFYSLKGQGETNGYFIGFIPAKGYYLASSLSLISQALEPENAQTPLVGCELPFDPDLRLIFSPALISSEALFNEIINKLALGATIDGRLAGCAQF